MCRLLCFPIRCSHLPGQKARSHIILMPIIYFPFKKGRTGVFDREGLSSFGWFFGWFFFFGMF